MRRVYTFAPCSISYCTLVPSLLASGLMKNQYDIAVFGAHPDDSEMAMGGTLIRLCQAGYSVINVSLTQSEMSTHGDIQSRKREFEAAAKFAGCDCLMLDFPDTGVQNDRESQIKVARLLRELKPKIIFAPYHTNTLAEPAGIANVDHYTAGSLVRDAIKLARLQKTVPELPAHTVQKAYFYMLPRTVWPNLVVDVSPVIDKFKQLLSSYSSQMAINMQGMPIAELLLRIRANVGISIGAEYAEGFVTDQALKLEPEMFLKV